jgi:threonylcarbamoyladenosine tRNA methylthiotransferase MtaB
MRIAFTTLGCKINQYETEQLCRDLLARGNTIVPFEAEADVYIINTCSVTAKSDYQCRQVVRSAVRRKEDARVVVTGCYATVSPDELKAIPGVEQVVPNEAKSGIPDLLMKQISQQACVGVPSHTGPHSGVAVPAGTKAHSDLTGSEKPEGQSERTRAFLKIQDGCNNSCSYCIVPVARGRSRSVPVSVVTNQFDGLVAADCPEIVLTGIHIGTYGTDLVPSVNLTSLMETLLLRRRASRIRLSSIEANEITPSLVAFLGKGLCRHLHIPLQSGDDTILSAMNRHYNSAFYRELVSSLARRVSGIALGADVIVGFPGEGEREFDHTIDLVQSTPLSHLHVFTYSMRPGTHAAGMKHQIPDSVKKKRSEVLRALARRKTQEFTRQFLGSELNVVIEAKKNPDNGLLIGLSDNYLRVSVVGAEKEHIGREIRVVLTEVSEKGNKAIIF